MKAAPYRKDFFKKLGDDQIKVNEEIKIWLESLQKIVDNINDFCFIKHKHLFKIPEIILRETKVRNASLF